MFDVGCFLKSQRKRLPRKFDDKLFVLWCQWEDAFPGKSINNFHGMFCTIRNFVWNYQMADQVSKESCKPFNCTLASTKSMLKCIPTINQRVAKVNERTQANLKGEVLKEKVFLKKASERKKRRPQKSRSRANDKRSVVCSQYVTVQFKGETYYKLPGRKLLLGEWIDIYLWFAGGIDPKEWSNKLARTVPELYT